MNKINGIIPLNKDLGMTSFDCVRKVRQLIHEKKVGHSGTLDPNVNGVLPICVGNATKVVDFLMASGKKYRGEITLGFATTTEDLDGDIIDSKPIEQPFNDQSIQQHLDQLVSDHLRQIPPMYSAVKVNGKRLYEYARAHETVERPVRYVQVKQFKMMGSSYYDAQEHTQRFRFEVTCGKGTYVRTLAVMLGELLGYPATMTQLTRTSSGHFNLAQTYSLTDIKNAYEKGKIAEIVYPLDYALQQFPQLEITTNQWKVVQNGGWLSARELKTTEPQLILKYQGQVKALYQPKPGTDMYAPKKMFSNK